MTYAISPTVTCCCPSNFGGCNFLLITKQNLAGLFLSLKLFLDSLKAVPVLKTGYKLCLSVKATKIKQLVGKVLK